MGTTYEEAGVDVAAVERSQESMGKLIRATHRATTAHGFGHYAGLVEIPGGRLLATHTDGVGTKVLIANMMERYDTVGIDCIAMNVNDVICVGARPVSFVDYIAASQNNQRIFEALASGLVEGAKTADVPIVGGETAIMPDLFSQGGFAFDLAGMVTGLVDKDALILGADIVPGDVVVGAASSGLHSNGYTLARRILFPKFSIHDRISGVGIIGEELLRPTTIYVRPVLEIIQKCNVHGLAHITGGSFAKLTRLKHIGYEIDSPPPVPPIMNLIAEQGVDDIEMYRTFNMGVGFCVVIPEAEAGSVLEAFGRHAIPSWVIGRITGKQGVRVGSRVLA